MNVQNPQVLILSISLSKAPSWTRGIVYEWSIQTNSEKDMFNWLEIRWIVFICFMFWWRCAFCLAFQNNVYLCLKMKNTGKCPQKYFKIIYGSGDKIKCQIPESILLHLLHYFHFSVWDSLFHEPFEQLKKTTGPVDLDIIFKKVLQSPILLWNGLGFYRTYIYKD